jgi:hypothetical protein
MQELAFGQAKAVAEVEVSLLRVRMVVAEPTLQAERVVMVGPELTLSGYTPWVAAVALDIH